MESTARRFLQGLTPPARLAVLVCLFLASSAVAHDLEARVHVLPFWRIQVESWFDSGDAARQAKVEVFEGERLIASGRLNGQGIWALPYQEGRPLRVVINAGAGHRREVPIGGEELRRQAASMAALALTPPPSLLAGPAVMKPASHLAEADPSPISERATSIPWGGLAIGVLVLMALGLAALVRSRKLQKHDPR